MKKEICLKSWMSVLVLLSCIFLGRPIQAAESGFTTPDPDKINHLVAGNYYGALRLGYNAGEYINNGFGLSSRPQDPSRQSFTWVTTRGTYGALVGYWIFRPDAHQCWQARNANGPLALWNSDGKARGNPEDWELFVFEYANDAKTAVFVKNIYGRYVRYGNPAFVCDASRDNAAAFTPEFD